MEMEMEREEEIKCGVETNVIKVMWILLQKYYLHRVKDNRRFMVLRVSTVVNFQTTDGWVDE